MLYLIHFYFSSYVRQLDIFYYGVKSIRKPKKRNIEENMLKEKRLSIKSLDTGTKKEDEKTRLQVMTGRGRSWSYCPDRVTARQLINSPSTSMSKLKI